MSRPGAALGRTSSRQRGLAGAGPVLVVGAGPAGSATAWRLARSGLDVLLLDARDFPRSKPCGDALSPGATPYLREMGVLEALEGCRPARLTGWRVRAQDGTWFEGGFSAPGAAAPDTGYALPRARLDALLLEAARSAGARFLPRRRVFELLREDGRVSGAVARDADGRVERHAAALVVGADGLRSRVARLLGGVRRGSRRRLALVGRWEGMTWGREGPAAGEDGPAPAARDGGPRSGEDRPSGPTGRGEMRLGRDGVLGFAPTGPGEANLTLVVPESEGPAIAAGPRDYYEARLRGYGAGDRIVGARLAADPEVTGPFEVLPRRLAAPGAILVGDAAGYFDPLTGQGIHRALAMAEAAARMAGQALADPADRGAEARARRRYEREARRLLVSSRRLQRLIDHLVTRPVPMAAAARLLAARPGLASLLVDVTGDRLPPSALLHPRRVLAALGRGAPSRRRRPRGAGRRARVHA